MMAITDCIYDLIPPVNHLIGLNHDLRLLNLLSGKIIRLDMIKSKYGLNKRHK
jgi:hypothetical protein